MPIAYEAHGAEVTGRPHDAAPIASELPSKHANRAIRTWYRVIAHLNLASAAVYVGVASLIGADAVALIIGSAAIWPVGIPLLIGLLAAGYYIQATWRHRRARKHGTGR